MTVLGHCCPLWSSAREINSYTHFPSGCLGKFQREVLEGVPSQMSQQTSVSSAGSTHRQQDRTGSCLQARVCQRGVTPEHDGH